MTSKKIAFLLPLAFAVIAPACKKESSPAAAPIQDSVTGASGASYTSRMGGVRHWHRYHYYHAEGMHFHTTINEDYFLPDTAFALTIVSDTSVAFFRYTFPLYPFILDTFSIDRTRSTSDIYYFGRAWSFFHYPGGLGVTYFSDRDSIVYGSSDAHETDDWIIRKDLWCTY